MPHERDGAGPVDGALRLSVALFEPDMAANVGAVIRIGACLGVPVHVIEPCGFPFSPKAWARTAMDYAALADIRRHSGWQNFLVDRPSGRLVALTTKGSEPLTRFAFRPGDTLLMGRETAGLPEEVHRAADARVVIPLAPGARSLNVAVAAGIALHEALRQTSPALPPGLRLRRGVEADIPRLGAVEAAGTALYATIGYDFVVGVAVRDAEEHLRGIGGGALLVAEGDAGPVGFALLWQVDGRAHLTELSVLPSHGGRGIGGALVRAALDWARAGLFPEITLTCFRDVPWNAPFYARLGWREIAVGPERPGLAEIVAEEAAAGYALRPRIAMARPLP